MAVSLLEFRHEDLEIQKKSRNSVGFVENRRTVADSLLSDKIDITLSMCLPDSESTTHQ